MSLLSSEGLVSLTYDGALQCHLETAFPQLEEAGLKGTFYCEPALLLENLPEWAHVQACGHEIGNGALHGAVLEDGSLPGWAPQMVAEDVSEAKGLIDDLFPEQPGHTFGFPWGRAMSDGVDVSGVARDIYGVVRVGEHGVNKAPFDFARVMCVQCDGLDSNDLVAIARQALEPKAWVVFSFEGIGSGERGIDACAHRDLCVYLATEPRLSVATLRDAAVMHAAPSSPIKLV